MQQLPLITVTLAASFLTPFMVSSVNIALPSIGRSLHMDTMSLAWITTSYLLTSAVLLVPFGKAGDRYGRARVFTIGMMLLLVSSALSCFAVNAPQLILLRILHGCGAAMIFGTGTAMLTSAYPAAGRGKILGINVACTYLGLTLGPALGGVLVNCFGWRSVFALPAAVSLASLVIIRSLPHVPDKVSDNSRDHIDLPGALLYTILLGCIIAGISDSSARTGKFLLVTGLLLAIPFLTIELRSKNPLLPVHVFRSNVNFSTTILSIFFMYCATYAIGFLMSLYLQEIKHFSAQLSGLVLITQPVLMVLISPAAGNYSDKTEPAWIATAGMLLATAGLVCISQLHPESPPFYIVIALTLCGIGFALFSSPSMSIIMGSVRKEDFGTASSAAGTVRLLGQVFSMGIVMSIMSFVSKNQMSSKIPTLIHLIHFAGMLFAVLCATGMMISLARILRAVVSKKKGECNNTPLKPCRN